jgi:hypothetical protein
MQKVHPVVLVFAAIGVVVFAYTAEQQLFGNDCCSGSKWQSHTAEYKLATLWENIIENVNSASWPGVKIGLLFVESMDPSFDRVADDLPWDRSKVIHSVGNHAQVRWAANTPVSSKYTGIIAKGGKFGIIRLSPAAEPEPDKGTTCDPQCGFVPGLGLKILRTGVLSGNIFAMYSLVGQPSFNFFRNNFTNHPELDCSDITGSTRALFMKFKTASNWPTTVGLSQLALFDEDGNEADPPKYPFQLILVPNSNLTNAYSDDPTSNPDATLAAQLAALPVGTALYDIWALPNPWDSAELIGSIQTTSTFTTSKWGDKNLFLEHTRMETDVLLHPEWKPYLPSC